MKLVYSGECVSHFFYPWLFNGTNGQRIGGAIEPVSRPGANQGESGKQGNDTERQDTDRAPLSPRGEGAAFDGEASVNPDGQTGEHTEHTTSALGDQVDEGHQPTAGSKAVKRRTQKRWGEEKVKLSFVVPDTILYSYSKPISWFYTDPKTGLLCRRTKKELTTPMIVDSFDICGTSKSGLKAMYFTPAASAAANPFASLTQGSSNPNAGTSSTSPSGRPSSSAVVDEAVYDIVTQGQLGRDGLFKFVQEPKGKGVLELVVDNKLESDGSLKNVVVHCEWTKTTFACEKWTSTYDLVHDRKRRLKDRLSMSPVRGDCIVSPIMAAAVKAQFKRVCEEIAECFEALPAGYRVLQLTVQCRIARNSKKNSKRGKQEKPGDALGTPSPELGGSGSPTPDQQPPSSPSPTPGAADPNKAGDSSSDEESRPKTRGTQPHVDHADRIAGLVTILLVSCHSMKLMMPSKHPNKIFVLTPQGTFCQDFRVRRISSGLDSNGSIASLQHKDSTALQTSSSQLAKSTTSITVSSGLTPCRVCQSPVRPEKVIEVELRWVLYALYLVDHHVGGLDPMATGEDEVPLSVSLLCPQMIRQEFDELISGKVGKGKASSSWYREKVNLCELCVEQCRASYHRIAELKLTPPDWIHVDGPKVPFNKGESRRDKSGSGASPARQGRGKANTPDSPNVSAIAPTKLKAKGDDKTNAGDESTALLEYQWSSFLGASPSRTRGNQGNPRSGGGGANEEASSAYFPGTGSMGNSIVQGSITGWWVNRRRNPTEPSKRRTEPNSSSTQPGSPTSASDSRFQVRIVIASKETPDAADLYSTGKGAVWKKIGFGVPEWEGQERFLLTAPRLHDKNEPAEKASSDDASENEKRPLNTIELKFLRRLHRKLQDVVEATSEEEEDGGYRRSTHINFDPPAPPDNSPAG